MKNFFKILYLVIAVLNILEYLFIAGLFTAPIVMLLVGIVGLINFIIAVKDKEYYIAVLYCITTVALSMGYWKLM